MRWSHWRPALAAVVLAAVPLVGLWGFTVDDALIPARVAANLRQGIGYRFNATGASVDAVTPLGWAYVLAPFAVTPPAALLAAQILGSAAWLCAVAFLGTEIARTGPSRWRFVPLVVLACNAPLAAWGVAGMETAVVMALTTFALAETRWAVLAASAAVFWRPELGPWAFVLCVGQALVRRGSPREILLTALSVLGAAGLSGVLRWYFFGSSVPLGFLAKPSDVAHGFRYCWGALRLTGVPLLLVGARQWRRVSPRYVVIAAAAAAHFGVVMLLGGDWMPFFRLLVPVLPGLLLSAGALAEGSSRWVNLARITAALVVSLRLAFTLGPSARQVGAARSRLMASATRLLEASDRVATLDVGWVGASTSATVIDLAGVTDPAVARLHGGHTSKILPPDFVDVRRPSVLILLIAENASIQPAWAATRFAREVEQRIARLAAQTSAKVTSIAQVPLAGTGQSYGVIRLTYP